MPVTAKHDVDAQLSAYMALPVSQFVLIDVPLGGKLKRIGTDLFEIIVPRVELFGIWVQPDIKCIVRSLPNEFTCSFTLQNGQNNCQSLHNAPAYLSWQSTCKPHRSFGSHNLQRPEIAKKMTLKISRPKV